MCENLIIPFRRRSTMRKRADRGIATTSASRAGSESPPRTLKTKRRSNMVKSVARKYTDIVLKAESAFFK
jgi:hypothetical protein